MKTSPSISPEFLLGQLDVEPRKRDSSSRATPLAVSHAASLALVRPKSESTRSAGHDRGREARQLGLNVAKLFCEELTPFVRIITINLQLLNRFLERPGNDIGIEDVLLDGTEHARSTSGTGRSRRSPQISAPADSASRRHSERPDGGHGCDCGRRRYRRSAHTR